VSIARVMHMRKATVQPDIFDGEDTSALCKVLTTTLLQCLSMARSGPLDQLRGLGSKTCSEDQLHGKICQRWSEIASIWWFLFPYLLLNHVMKVDAFLETLIILTKISSMARNGAILQASTSGMSIPATTMYTTLMLLTSVHDGVALGNKETNGVGLPHMEGVLKFFRYAQKWQSSNNDPLQFGDEWLLEQVRSVELQQLTQQEYLLCQAAAEIFENLKEDIRLLIGKISLR
jgi:hypothetical protein